MPINSSKRLLKNIRKYIIKKVCVSGYAYWEDLIKSIYFDHPNLAATNIYTECKQLISKKHSNTRKKYGI